MKKYVRQSLMSQYDLVAKKLLSHKRVLAMILSSLPGEFSGLSPEAIVKRIEGVPSAGSVPVSTDFTHIAGLNTEGSEFDAGTVFYDVLFYVSTGCGLSKVIINIEAQKDEPRSYGLLNRAIFYSSRLISSQKEKFFTGSDYDNIQKTLSVWICMNQKTHSLGLLSLDYKKLLGDYIPRGRTDLLETYFIGLSNDVENVSSEETLHRFLGTLFSGSLSRQEKFRIIQEEFSFVNRREIKEEVDAMCNLSLGVFEQGVAEGVTKGLSQGRALGLSQGRTEAKNEMIWKMHLKGFSLSAISDITSDSVRDVELVIQMLKEKNTKKN